MGYPKLDEDNKMIYDDRIVMGMGIENKPCSRQFIEPAMKHIERTRFSAPVKRPVRRDPNDLRIIELHADYIDKKTLCIMKRHGWWWSKTNVCWSNVYTENLMEGAAIISERFNANMIVVRYTH